MQGPPTEPQRGAALGVAMAAWPPASVSLKGWSLVRDLRPCFGLHGNCCPTTGNQPWPGLASGPVMQALLREPEQPAGGSQREGGALAPIRGLGECSNQSLGCLLSWAHQDSLGLGLVSTAAGWRAAPCWCRQAGLMVVGMSEPWQPPPTPSPPEVWHPFLKPDRLPPPLRPCTDEKNGAQTRPAGTPPRSLQPAPSRPDPELTSSPRRGPPKDKKLLATNGSPLP